MAIESFKKEWQFVKKNYEKATGKKKPSAKLAGAWNKHAAGLEPSCGNLDSALQKHDVKAAKTALASLQSAGSAYIKVLAEAAAGEDKQIGAELKVMIGELNNIMKEAAAKVSEMADKAEMANAALTGWKLIAKEYMTSSLPTNPNLKAFVVDKKFGMIPGTTTPNKQLQSCQGAARDQTKRYMAKLAGLKSLKMDPMDPKVVKAYFTAMMEANDELNVNGGLLDTLGQWRLVASGKAGEGAAAYNNSALKPVVDQLNDALSGENQRLGLLQQQFERQVMKTR